MTNDSTAGCGCGTSKTETPVIAAEDRKSLLNDSAGETTCPVMVGTPVVKSIAEAQGLFRDYEGQRYWFCCAGCGPAFDSDPAHYAANMV